MARPALSRFLSRFDRRWLLALLGVAGLVLIIRAMPRSVPEPPLELVALTAQGAFRDTLAVPASWADSSARPHAIRVPLVLAVRNDGERAARPQRLTLSLPVAYRLMASNRQLQRTVAAGSPLAAYVLETGLEPVQPGRMPTVLPSVDTLWLQVRIPSLHCVVLADSVPEFIPAPVSAREVLRDVRVFYSFEGGDLSHRRAGTLTLSLDSTLFDVDPPEPAPVFPAVNDSALARPATGPLERVRTGVGMCGDAQNPMAVEAVVWATRGPGHVYELSVGGLLRKRLYDLDGDTVIERESWDGDGDGVLESTRQARLPVPDLLRDLQPVAAGEGSTSGA